MRKAIAAPYARDRFVTACLCLAMEFAAGAALAQGQNTPTPPEPAPAGTATPANDHDINRTELNHFDEYLDGHPGVHKQLNRNPSLINNQAYLQAHPHLQTFLKNHPGVQEESSENPKQFMHRENQFLKKGGDVSHAEAARADHYLDQHPKLARQLQRNPKLVDNPKFMANHPSFNNYLQKHPEIRQDIKQHPYAFQKRQRQFERHEGPEHIARPMTRMRR